MFVSWPPTSGDARHHVSTMVSCRGHVQSTQVFLKVQCCHQHCSIFPSLTALTSYLLTSYAYDLTLFESGYVLDNLSAHLDSDVKTVAEWALRKKLVLAPNKSLVTLFTHNRHQSNAYPQVSIDGANIPLNKNPKILGITWDQILPSTSTSWMCSKERLNAFRS
jgi:hypothetical protein